MTSGLISVVTFKIKFYLPTHKVTLGATKTEEETESKKGNYLSEANRMKIDLTRS
jgi:hypothetical protein